MISSFGLIDRAIIFFIFYVFYNSIDEINVCVFVVRTIFYSIDEDINQV